MQTGMPWSLSPAPTPQSAPDTEFDIRALQSLPRVDIAYAYAGDDGVAVKAFLAAGAKGIVTTSLAPGLLTPGTTRALTEAVSAGTVVVLSSGSARVAFSRSPRPSRPASYRRTT